MVEVSIFAYTDMNSIGCYQENDKEKEIFGYFTNGVLNGRGVQFSMTSDQKGYHVVCGNFMHQLTNNLFKACRS